MGHESATPVYCLDVRGRHDRCWFLKWFAHCIKGRATVNLLGASFKGSRRGCGPIGSSRLKLRYNNCTSIDGTNNLTCNSVNPVAIKAGNLCSAPTSGGSKRVLSFFSPINQNLVQPDVTLNLWTTADYPWWSPG